MVRATTALSIALLVVVIFTPAEAQKRSIPPGLLLVLEGYVGPRRPNDWGSNQLWLYSRHHKRSYQFQLQHLRVINAGILPNQIIVTLTPNRPSLYLYGEKAAVDVLAAATPADQVVITGYTGNGFNFQVSKITAAPPGATPSPSSALPSPSSATPAPGD